MSDVRVLLALDDDAQLRHLEDLLAQLAPHLACTRTSVRAPDEALATLCADGADVCLLAYQLGDRDGLDLLREAVAAGTTTPCVVLTGAGARELEQRALADGACGYLSDGDLSVRSLERALRHALERGRTLAALRASERQLHAIFDHSLDAMLIADDDGRYLDGNPAALALLGVDRARLLTMSVADIAATPRAPDVWPAFLRRGTMVGDVELRRADGELRTVEFRAVAHILPGRHLSVLRDVTERRRDEEYRLRLTTIVEAADDAIDGTSLDGTINFWSTGAERLYGYTAAEVLGRPKQMLVPPEAAADFAEAIARVTRGETLRHMQTRRRRKDGRIFDAAVTMSPIRDGGATVGISVLTRDVTEMRQLEQRIAIADRMASVGTLAAGVVHEINNPLAAITMNLELLAEELLRPPRRLDEAALAALREIVADARDGVHRLRDIVLDLRVFSRPDETRRGAIDVNQVLESSARMAWNEIRHRAQLVRDLGALPNVLGNDSRLGQVFLNLIVNAAQAIPDGNAADNFIRLATRTDADGRAVIEITDTGSGIHPDHLGKLFDPFFTTKPVGMGTGLGLSISHRIVTELGGTIAVESELGRGTTFRVCLPPSPEPLASTGVHRREPLLPPRRARVLVVDDEPMMATAIVRVLGAEHDVIVCDTGDEAVQRIAAGERYDVIFSDVMMPQMTGMELHAAVRAIDPAQASAFVFMTGGTFTETGAAFLERVENPRLEKPFTPLQLRAIVADRLAR